METTLNIEQIRASHAFKLAEKGNEQEAEAKKNGSKFNYSAQMKSFPPLLKTNGLLNSLGFYYAKGKDFANDNENEFATIFNQILSWFREHEPTGFLKNKFTCSAETNAKTKAKEFMQILLRLSEEEYRFAFNETKAFTKWLVRFVADEPKNEPKNEPDKQPETV